MKISPRFSTQDYWNLALTPKSDNNSWRKAVQIFHDRIEGRFLRWIRRVEKYKYSGFVVLALDCLLAETLQAFKEGKPNTRNETRKVFIRFLRNAKHFKVFRKKGRANHFYRHVRSRLVHHADTTGGWLIHRGRKLPLLKRRDRKAYIVNRSMFHKALLRELEDYQRDLLLKKPPWGYRRRFIRKMEAICKSEIPQ